jgi:hypothetical protein
VLKKSTSRSKSKGSATSAVSPLFDGTAKRQSGRSSTENFYEEEENFVSADELKYGLKAEKGLAWIDLGGKLTKMRALWVDFDLPQNWTGRNCVLLLDPRERDALSLATWVNREVVQRETLNEKMTEPSVPSLRQGRTQH